MKKILIALLLVSTQAFADEWRTADSYREGVFLGLHAWDYLQSRQIAKNPNPPGHAYYESNSLLGEHPSVAEVNRYFIISGLLQAGIAYKLPPPWREAFQYVSIGDKIISIRTNWFIGIHGKW